MFHYHLANTLDGHVLRQQMEQLEIGEQTFSIDLTSLDKGSYIIQLDDGKNKVHINFY